MNHIKWMIKLEKNKNLFSKQSGSLARLHIKAVTSCQWFVISTTQNEQNFSNNFHKALRKNIIIIIPYSCPASFIKDLWQSAQPFNWISYATPLWGSCQTELGKLRKQEFSWLKWKMYVLLPTAVLCGFFWASLEAWQHPSEWKHTNFTWLCISWSQTFLGQGPWQICVAHYATW